MSYCRWSSDFGECDVYVYADVNGGWTIHVAGRRLKHRVPDHIKNMEITGEDGLIDAGLFAEKYQAEREWRKTLPKDEHGFIDENEYLDLSEISEHAGESYNLPTPGECADKLEEIRESGLNVPQYAIDDLRQEANDE